MTASLPNNPFGTYVGTGLFQDPSANGLVQGVAYPDPATIFQLRRGWLSNTETIPLWGGCAVYELTPSFGNVALPRQALGVQVGRATTVVRGAKPIAGFSVFDAAYAMVVNPSSTVPMVGSYGQVNTYRLGSGVRLQVACDPALIDAYAEPVGSTAQAALSAVAGGAPYIPPVSWDFVNQLLIPYTGAIVVSSGTYNNTTGAVVLTLASAPAMSAGSSLALSALTGTGAYASLDGTWTATAVAGTSVSFTAPAGLGATTITGGSFTTGAPLPIAGLLEVQPTGCMTVHYNSTTNTASWNYDGCCAVIQL